MQFIAVYLGACILESSRRSYCSRAELARRIADFKRTRRRAADWDHKAILLLEYLCRTGALDGQTAVNRVN